MTESKYKRITISFTDADSDIVKYLEELKESGRASEFIREAIREKMNKGNTLTEDWVRSIVKEMVPNLIPQSQPTTEVKEVTEYPKIVSNLKKSEEESIDKAVLDAIDSFDF